MESGQPQPPAFYSTNNYLELSVNKQQQNGLVIKWKMKKNGKMYVM